MDFVARRQKLYALYVDVIHLHIHIHIVIKDEKCSLFSQPIYLFILIDTHLFTSETEK